MNSDRFVAMSFRLRTFQESPSAGWQFSEVIDAQITAHKTVFNGIA